MRPDPEGGEIERLREALERERERFDVFAATLPGISWEVWGRPYSGQVSYVSSSVAAISGYTPEDWLDRPGFVSTILHPDDRARVVRDADASFEAGERSGTQEYRMIRRDGSTLDLHVRYSILRSEDGEAFAWQAFSLDITALRQAEAERDRMQDTLIRHQAELLSELSTPLLPISDELLVMPLIGRLDRERVERAILVLLPGLARARARFAILDITGVPEIDVGAATALVRAAGATKMLGVELLITGIRPEVALAFCSLGEHFEQIVTLATLQSGVAYAMQRGRARRPGR